MDNFQQQLASLHAIAAEIAGLHQLAEIHDQALGYCLDLTGSQFAFTGLLSWALSEWLLHRYLYHEWPSFLAEGHTLHHDRPRALIGVPWYLTTIAIILLFQLLALVFRPSSTGLVMGFNWLGYIFYCITHHGSHHWHLKRGWLGRMKRHHLIHHAHPEYNWGFTTPLWDYVFGTHYNRRKKT